MKHEDEISEKAVQKSGSSRVNSLRLSERTKNPKRGSERRDIGIAQIGHGKDWWLRSTVYDLPHPLRPGKAGKLSAGNDEPFSLDRGCLSREGKPLGSGLKLSQIGHLIICMKPVIRCRVFETGIFHFLNRHSSEGLWSPGKRWKQYFEAFDYSSVRKVVWKSVYLSDIYSENADECEGNGRFERSREVRSDGTLTTIVLPQAEILLSRNPNSENGGTVRWNLQLNQRIILRRSIACESDLFPDSRCSALDIYVTLFLTLRANTARCLRTWEVISCFQGPFFCYVGKYRPLPSVLGAHFRISSLFFCFSGKCRPLPSALGTHFLSLRLYFWLSKQIPPSFLNSQVGFRSSRSQYRLAGVNTARILICSGF